MDTKLTYEELEQRVKEFETELIKCKQSKNELQEKEKKLKTCLELCSIGYWEWDLLTDKMHWSDEIYRIYGLKKNIELSIKIVSEMIHPNDRGHFEKALADAIDGNATKYLDYRIVTPDGEVRFIRSFSEFLYDNSGNLIRISGTGQDVTSLKRTEEALSNSQEMANAFLNATTDIAIMIDRFGIIFAANDRFARIFNRNPEEIINRNVFHLFHRQLTSIRKEITQKIIKSGKKQRYQEELFGIWHDVIVYPIFDKSGDVEYIVVFAHDITELKKIEIMLKESKNALEEKVFERTSELAEVNTALRILMKNRDLDVIEIEEKILSNFHELVVPNLDKLKKSKLNNSQKMLIEVIQKNIEQVTSDFGNVVSNKYLMLTPSEIKVVNLIKHGKTNKEIAELHNISVRTVESHRTSIRKKIGIKTTKMSLRSYLLTNV